MEQEALLQRIYEFGIVPVIALEDVADAAPLAKALCNGGLALAEVTYRTACAHDAMVEMKKACPDMLVGAGTVLTKEQVDSAIDAGAEFIVSPGLNPNIVSYCQEKNIPIIPGCATPSDLEKALELGLTTVKFFPAEANGGIASIKAMAAPYGNLRFMPTGGVNEENLLDYLNYDKILACGGTWMVKSNLIKAKQFDKIEELTRNAVTKMLHLQVAHIGINTKEASDASAKLLASFSRCDLDERTKSIFAGAVELMKEPAYGTHGHIAYSTSNVDRAVFYLKQAGFTFNETSATYDASHHRKFIYANEEVSGFALHLVKEA